MVKCGRCFTFTQNIPNTMHFCHSNLNQLSLLSHSLSFLGHLIWPHYIPEGRICSKVVTCYEASDYFYNLPAKAFNVATAGYWSSLGKKELLSLPFIFKWRNTRWHNRMRYKWTRNEEIQPSFLHRAKTRLSILYRNLDLCFYIICELVYKMCFSLSQLFLYQKCMGDIMNLLLRIHLLKSTY